MLDPLLMELHCVAQHEFVAVRHGGRAVISPELGERRSRRRSCFSFCLPHFLEAKDKTRVGALVVVFLQVADLFPSLFVLS